MAVVELDPTPEINIESLDKVHRNHRRQARVVIFACGATVDTLMTEIEDELSQSPGEKVIHPADLEGVQATVDRDDADVLVFVAEEDSELPLVLVSEIGRALPIVVVHSPEASIDVSELEEAVDLRYPNEILNLTASPELADQVYSAAADYRMWPVDERADA